MSPNSANAEHRSVQYGQYTPVRIDRFEHKAATLLPGMAAVNSLAGTQILVHSAQPKLPRRDREKHGH